MGENSLIERGSPLHTERIVLVQSGLPKIKDGVQPPPKEQPNKAVVKKDQWQLNDPAKTQQTPQSQQSLEAYKYIFNSKFQYSPFAQITMAKDEYLKQYGLYKRGKMSKVDKTAFEAQGILLETYGYTLKDEKQIDGSIIKKWNLSIDLNRIQGIRKNNSEYLKTIGYSTKQIKALSKYMLLEDLALTLIRTNNLQVNPGQAFVMSRTLATFPKLKDNKMLHKQSPLTDKNNDCIMISLSFSLASKVNLNSDNPDNEINDLADAIQNQANILNGEIPYPKESRNPILRNATEITPPYTKAAFPNLPGIVLEMKEFGYELDDRKYSYNELKNMIRSKQLPPHTMIVMIDVGILNFHVFSIMSSKNGKTYTPQVDGGITPYITNTVVDTEKLFADIENNSSTQDTQQTAVYILRPHNE